MKFREVYQITLVNKYLPRASKNNDKADTFIVYSKCSENRNDIQKHDLTGTFSSRALSAKYLTLTDCSLEEEKRFQAFLNDDFI